MKNSKDPYILKEGAMRLEECASSPLDFEGQEGLDDSTFPLRGFMAPHSLAKLTQKKESVVLISVCSALAKWSLLLSGALTLLRSGSSLCK